MCIRDSFLPALTFQPPIAALNSTASHTVWWVQKLQSFCLVCTTSVWQNQDCDSSLKIWNTTNSLRVEKYVFSFLLSTNSVLKWLGKIDQKKIFLTPLFIYCHQLRERERERERECVCAAFCICDCVCVLLVLYCTVACTSTSCRIWGLD